MRRLLISFEPYEDECINSYILRLSNANLYNSNWIYNYIGMHKRYFSRILPDSREIGILSQITNVSKEKLNRLTYRNYGDELCISSYVNSHNTKICPICFKKSPYQRKIWSCKTVIACHIHGCLLKSTCPQCDKYISVNRMEIEKCNCGEELSNLPVTLANQQETDYSRIIYRLEYGLNIKGWSHKKLFDDLCILTTEEILYLTRCFMYCMEDIKKHKYTWADKIKEHEEGYYEFISHSHQIFTDWPWGFRRYLEYFIEEYMATPKTQLLKLKKFRTIYNFLYKDLSDKKYNLLRDEYEKFMPTPLNFGIDKDNNSINLFTIYPKL